MAKTPTEIFEGGKQRLQQKIEEADNQTARILMDMRYEGEPMFVEYRNEDSRVVEGVADLYRKAGWIVEQGPFNLTFDYPENFKLRDEPNAA